MPNVRGWTNTYQNWYIRDVEELRRKLIWMGSTREDLRAMPVDVRRAIGYALDWAQRGWKHPRARAMKGPLLGGVMEVVEDFDGDTYRTAYIARFASAIYVLHVFQKKSVRGIATPRRHLATIRRRLTAARALDSGGGHAAR